MALLTSYGSIVAPARLNRLPRAKTTIKVYHAICEASDIYGMGIGPKFGRPDHSIFYFTPYARGILLIFIPCNWFGWHCFCSFSCFGRFSSPLVWVVHLVLSLGSVIGDIFKVEERGHSSRTYPFEPDDSDLRHTRIGSPHRTTPN